MSLLVISLFFSISAAYGQIKPAIDCNNLEPGLTDTVKFEKAVECRNSVKNAGNKNPLEISSLPLTVRVVNLASSCREFKKSDSNWVTVLDELKEFYNKHSEEFQNDPLNLENRLEKLIGVNAGSYKCFIVYDVSRDLLRKTTENDDDKRHPFTNKGFTCDWFYKNTGCSYGLSEFIVKTDDESTTQNKYRKNVEHFEFKKPEKIIKYLKEQ